MSQINLATLPCCGLQGIIANVSKSGKSSISDDSTSENPAIEDASKTTPSSSAFSIC